MYSDNVCFDIMCYRPYMRWGDQLFLALNILAAKESPYRVVVVDEEQRVKGVITGRRMLEILLGRRGESLKEKKGLRGVLREPVNLFVDEARNIFPENTPVRVVLQYMFENNIGFVIVVNEKGVLQGLVDEVSILGKLKGKRFDVKVEDAMKSPVVTVSPDATLLSASNTMLDHRVRRLIVAEEGKLKGIITVTDILRYVLETNKHLEMILRDVGVETIFEEKRVGEIMETDVVSVNAGEDLGKVVDKMVDFNVSCLPVLEQERLIGVISRVDVISGLVKFKGADELVKIMD